MRQKKSKKPPRLRYFLMTIDIQGMLENVLCEGNLAQLFEKIARKGAYIVNSIEVSKIEFEKMGAVREALIKESEEAAEAAKKKAQDTPPPKLEKVPPVEEEENAKTDN